MGRRNLEMKNLLKIFSLCMLMFGSMAFGQDSRNGTVIDVKSLNDNSTILFKSPPSKIFSINLIKKDNSTILEPVFDNPLFSKLRVELYNSAGKMITSYIDEKGQTRGPSVGLDNNLWGSNDSPFETVTMEKKKWWPIIVAVALCCVKGHYGSGGWEVGFDCTCLGAKTSNSNSGSIPVSINGKNFDVSMIKFVPLDSAGETIYLGDSNWDVSAK